MESLQVFPSYEPSLHSLAGSQPALLLEGDWPEVAGSAPRWSLDEWADARVRWIDDQATALAAELGTGGDRLPPAGLGRWDQFAYINAAALRYYLVKLLRTAAWFEQLAAGPVHRRPRRVVLHARRERHEDYAPLIASLGGKFGWPVSTLWSGPQPSQRETQPVNTIWRRWAGQLACSADRLLDCCSFIDRRTRAVVADTPVGPRSSLKGPVVFCGNPRILARVCEELHSRRIAACWLYDRFAIAGWFRWRRRGVRQLVLNSDRGSENPWSRGSVLIEPVDWRGVDLTRSLAFWMAGRAATHGLRQAEIVRQVRRQFERVRPGHIVLDEDASPLQRIVIAVARQLGIPSTVVQHGVPCVQFGFAPLAADRICVWGDTSRDQLVSWGVPRARIAVTGAPYLDAVIERLRRENVERRIAPGRPRQVLLLANGPPRSARPDSVELHLTDRTNRETLSAALGALAARSERLEVTIKLHPRAPQQEQIDSLLARFPGLRARVICDADLHSLLDQADLVLSCASTAGMEATLWRLPVIQLLPRGSGDLLPAEDWGLIGSARCREELDNWLDVVLSGQPRPRPIARAIANLGSPAAPRVVDDILEHSSPTGSAQAADRQEDASMPSASGNHPLLRSTNHDGVSRP